MSHNRAKSKKVAKRLARKRALKWVSDITHDTMRSGRRLYGQGMAK